MESTLKILVLNQMYSLKDLIPKAANKLHLQGELKAAWVINRASALVKEVFPEEISSEIRVKKFSQNVLWLAVTHSIIAQEVHGKSQLFLSQLNQSLGEKLVFSIRTFQETRPSRYTDEPEITL